MCSSAPVTTNPPYENPTSAMPVRSSYRIMFNVTNVRGERDLWAGEVNPLADPGEARREHVVSRRPQQGANAAEPVGTAPRPVHQHERGHLCRAQAAEMTRTSNPSSPNIAIGAVARPSPAYRLLTAVDDELGAQVFARGGAVERGQDVVEVLRSVGRVDELVLPCRHVE